MDEFARLLIELLENDAVQSILRHVHHPCARLILLEDFCQDVLLLALKHQHSFRGQDRGQLIAWLRSIGQQQMITHLRRSRRENLVPLPVDLASRVATPQEILIRQERRARLQALLAALTPNDRDLLVRHYEEGQSFVDMAQELGEQPNTLVRRHLRLLDKLRRVREF